MLKIPFCKRKRVIIITIILGICIDVLAIIMTELMMSIMLTMLSPVTNIIPLTNKKSPNTSIRLSSITWNTPKIQKTIATNTSSIPSIFIIMGL